MMPNKTANKTANKTLYDLIIIGGGLVGLTLARALAPYDFYILVLDNQEPQLNWPAESYGLRVSALNHVSQTILENLNIWSELVALRISPYEKMFVWDDANKGACIEFDCTDIGQNALGHIVENRVLLKVLYEQLQNYENVHLLCGKPQKLLAPDSENSRDSESSEDFIPLFLEDGTALKAKLLVGADGANSWVRAQLGIDSLRRSYGQEALITTVRTEHPHHRTAWQRFLPTGPLAFLPLSDPHICSIVWSTLPETAQKLVKLNAQALGEALTEAFAKRLGKVEVLDKALSFPLQMSHAKKYSLPRVVLVGDAAHTIHPLAGQGVNLGLLDSACLAQVVLAAQAKERDWGALACLRQYERWRKTDNVMMLAAMEGFKQLFGSQTSWIIHSRQMALQWVNQQTFLKQQLMSYAMGFQGDLLELAKSRP
jgi:2-octaprenylphenol hydroxylase